MRDAAVTTNDRRDDERAGTSHSPCPFCAKLFSAIGHRQKGHPIWRTEMKRRRGRQPKAAPHLPFDRINACGLHPHQHFVETKRRHRELADRNITRFAKVAQNRCAPNSWIGRLRHWNVPSHQQASPTRSSTRPKHIALVTGCTLSIHWRRTVVLPFFAEATTTRAIFGGEKRGSIFPEPAIPPSRLIADSVPRAQLAGWGAIFFSHLWNERTSF